MKNIIWIDDLVCQIYEKNCVFEFSIKCIEYKAQLKYIIIATRKVWGIFNKRREVGIGPQTLKRAFNSINYNKKDKDEITSFIKHKHYMYSLTEDNNLCYSNYELEDAKKMLLFLYELQQTIFKLKVELKTTHLNNQIYIEKFNNQSKTYINND